MTATTGHVTVAFGPAQRGAPDDLWPETTDVLQGPRRPTCSSEPARS